MKLAVAGGGAWGTALAALCAADRDPITLWVREADVADLVNRTRTNSVFLPGIKLPDGITATTELAALQGADAILLTIPAQYVRAVTTQLASILTRGIPLVICTKGIEQGRALLMSEVLAETMPRAIPAILSGPSFAREVAEGKPTAVTLAIADAILGRALVQRIGRPSFRPYLSDDLIGAQLGGAVKNVLAIGCGIVDGRGLGESARAAVITRGFAEMTRLARKRGARIETLAGLSGLGDLVLTCSSVQSRNFALGQQLGRGIALQPLLTKTPQIAEGAFSASALVMLARKENVEMPIAAAVDAILDGSVSIDTAIEGLLTRPFRDES